MNFLKDIHSKRRLFLQLESYQNTAHFELTNSLVDKSGFELENIFIENIDLSKVEIANNLRLGNRLELFFEFLINQANKNKILAKNIQIVDDKITIGELDFIIEDLHSKTIKHIEIATKFYLYDENLKEWIGPNRNDSLLAKCKKLKEKQFPLLFHQRTYEVLDEKNISLENIEQSIHYKAQLFIPFTINKNTFDKNIITNIAGTYLNKSQFLELADKAYKYFIPEKQDWLVEPKNGEVWFSFEIVLQSILLHFKDCKNPLVWIKKSDTEFEKCFVVDW
ncbi:MAG: DUF1853 family protein [Chitinophagales bacterium]